MNKLTHCETEDNCKKTILFFGSSVMNKNVVSTTTEEIIFVKVPRFIDFSNVTYSEAFETMLASEDVLRKEWDTPEEDQAWATL